MDKKSYIILTIIGGLLIALGWLGHDMFNTVSFTKEIASDTSSNCSNLSIIETSECLKEELSGFFNYNLSNVGKVMNLDELKKEGGVCHHYADWYRDEMKLFGFSVKEVVIFYNDSLDHVFTVASNEEAYCVLDQLNIYCVAFGGKK